MAKLQSKPHSLQFPRHFSSNLSLNSRRTRTTHSKCSRLSEECNSWREGGRESEIRGSDSVNLVCWFDETWENGIESKIELQTQAELENELNSISN